MADRLCPASLAQIEHRVDICRCEEYARVRADEADKHPDVFSVAQGTCGHVWRARDAVADWCPVCFEINNRVHAARRDVLGAIRAEVGQLLALAKAEREALPGLDGYWRDDPHGYGIRMYAAGRSTGIAEVLYGPLAKMEDEERHGR